MKSKVSLQKAMLQIKINFMKFYLVLVYLNISNTLVWRYVLLEELKLTNIKNPRKLTN